MVDDVIKETEKLACSAKELQEIHKKIATIENILELILDEPQPQPQLQPQPQPACPQPTDPYPELASLGKYMRQHNITSIYGISTNTWFLSNILWGYIPLDSAAWHPQSLSEWAAAQIGEAYFGVLAALLLRCIDSILAALAARGMKIRPTWAGKVK
jgi:hypothetical protein